MFIVFNICVFAMNKIYEYTVRPFGHFDLHNITYLFDYQTLFILHEAS